MAFIDIGTAALRYERSGEGAVPLVLIHELGGTLESWDGVVPRLDPAVAVLRYDMRGAGLSEKLRGPVAFEVMSDDLARLLDALGLAGPVMLAGCAVGAGVALDFAARFAARVRGVVALAPAAWIPPERQADALAFADAIEADGLRPRVAIAVERAFSAGSDPAVRAAYAARWLGNDARGYAEIYRMLVRSELAERVTAVRCPVLAIAGTHDAVRPAADVRALAEMLPNADYREIASGHFMPVESPALVADAINGMLRKLS